MWEQTTSFCASVVMCTDSGENMLLMCVNVGNGFGTSPSRALYPLEEWQVALAISPDS